MGYLCHLFIPPEPTELRGFSVNQLREEKRAICRTDPDFSYLQQTFNSKMESSGKNDNFVKV